MTEPTVASSTPGGVTLPPKFNLSSQAHNYDRQSLPTTFLWTREYAGGKVVAAEPCYLDQPNPPSVFERALHTVAMKIRRSSSDSGESAKSRQWQEDRKSVFNGSCTFHVQYLGAIDVHESKGIKVCEDAITFLIQQENKAAQKKDTRLTGNAHMTKLHITANTITVVDDETQNVLVEDTIQSISYCAAHRRREKSFAYITRVSPQERIWVCHAFTAHNATGERLSHAVGCAFEACHEKMTAVDDSNAELTNSSLQLPHPSQHGAHAAAAAGTTSVVADINVSSSGSRHIDSSSSAKGTYHPVSLQMEDM